jgi:D-glycero-alpha-D-manno-heptose 1-phosphate guanylyltransferase
MECIILAGGLGTRLRNTIGDYPKCMAAVNERPFLHYIFQYLQQQGCKRAILSLGYKHEVITSWLEKGKPSFETDFVIENEPLGTGGGIQLALQKAKSDTVAVLNGDTFFNIDLNLLFSFHSQKKAMTSLALKPMLQFERYGAVHVDENDCILAFEEKSFREKGLINGGVYVLSKAAFFEKHLPAKFSFEKDYLEAFVNERTFYGQQNDEYFIDIGIPQDYVKAQEDFLKIL